MSRRKGYSIKIFPWAPGLPWKVKYGKFVVPELPLELLGEQVKGKELVVCAFGGFLESFYSLSILELLNYHFSQEKLFWAGYDNYVSMVEAQGLAKFFSDISNKDCHRFPTPIFMDRNDRVYFNCLQTFRWRRGYYEFQGGRFDKRPAIEQITEKSCFPWTSQHLPKFRKKEVLGSVENIFKSRGFKPVSDFILLVPDSTHLSSFPTHSIEWNRHQINSFLTLATQKGRKVVLMTSEPQTYWGIPTPIIPFSVEAFLLFVSQARYIISQDPDPILISLTLQPEITIFTEYTWKLLAPDQNAKFVDSDADILLGNDWTPMKVLENL